MNAITTRRSLARQPAAPPVIRRTIDIAPRPPVAHPPERQSVISTDFAAGVGVGLFFGAWLMGFAIWIA
jgi:hypothetical protein